MNQPPFLKPDEVAEVLRVSRRHVYNLIASGALPSFRVGRSHRIPREAVERLTQARPDAAQGEKRS